MGFAGIADADERRQVIELLKWKVEEQRERR
jgi:cytochrome c2